MSNIIEVDELNFVRHVRYGVAYNGNVVTIIYCVLYIFYIYRVQ